jgi:hypothetical protein
MEEALDPSQEGMQLLAMLKLNLTDNNKSFIYLKVIGLGLHFGMIGTVTLCELSIELVTPSRRGETA